MRKKKVLFVGSFIEKAKDGNVGGQMYACKSLLSSSLSEDIEWILLDTTGLSVPPPPVYIRIFYAFWRLLKFIYLVIIKRPDCTLIFSANGPSVYEKGMMVRVASLFGIKSIFAPRGGPLVKEIAESSTFKKYVADTLKRSSYVICQGTFWKTLFKELVPEQPDNKFVVLPNWMDVGKYNYLLPNMTTRKPGVVTILFMGWIQQDKGVYDIYTAAAENNFPGVKLNFVFLGDGPARQDLIAKFSLLQTKYTFEFPGWVYGDEKKRYLSEADIFILPSYAEGMPNSLMEAMVSGVASIATNVGAIPDLISNYKTGIMVDVKNPEQIAEAINFLIAQPKNKSEIVANARKLIESGHSLENAVIKFKSLIV